MEDGTEVFSIEHSDARKMVEEKQNNDIAMADDLSAEEVETILNKISNQLDIELSEYQAYEKYKLRKCYKYKDKITPKFVEYYKHRNVQRIYHNLCDITQKNTIQESIELILKKENERYGLIVTNDSKYKNKLEYLDLHNESIFYTSLSHIIISNIISIIETKLLNKLDLDKIIDKDIWPLIMKHEKTLSIDLNIEFSDKKITVINKLLKAMYGLRICKMKNMFKLKKCSTGSLFTFSEYLIPGTVTIITSNKIFLNL
jgi:hypothetical protein